MKQAYGLINTQKHPGYDAVKFEVDRSKGFGVLSLETTPGQTDGPVDFGHINLIGALVTHNPPKNSICHSLAKYICLIEYYLFCNLINSTQKRILKTIACVIYGA